MNLTQLRAFHVVARAGSFSLAARTGSASQPTLSAQVKALEAGYGVGLFARKGRGVQLTPAGQSLHAITTRLFAAEEEAQALLAGSRALTRGHLRVSADSAYHVKLENAPVTGGPYVIKRRSRDQEIVLHQEATRRDFGKFLALSLAMFGLSLMSSQIGVGLPVFLLLCEAGREGAPGRWKVPVKRTAGFFLIAGVAATVTLWTNWRPSAQAVAWFDHPLPHRALQAIGSSKALADREAILRAAARGEHLSTLSLSEKGSRSQFWAPLSALAENGDGFVTSAKKSWVTAANFADSYVSSAQAMTCAFVPTSGAGMS